MYFVNLYEDSDYTQMDIAYIQYTVITIDIFHDTIQSGQFAYENRW